MPGRTLEYHSVPSFDEETKINIHTGQYETRLVWIIIVRSIQSVGWGQRAIIVFLKPRTCDADAICGNTPSKRDKDGGFGGEGMIKR